MDGFKYEYKGGSVVVKVTTRAMMGIEAAFGGRSVEEVFIVLEKAPTVTSIVKVLAELMNEGAGATIEEAQALVDSIGIENIGDVIGGAAKLAFPEGDAKNE